MPEFDKWFADKAEALRYNYDLNENSIVFDLGVYEGFFSEKIHNKYGCYVYGFEPVKSFFENSKKILQKYEKIKLFNYGIGSEDSYQEISIQNDSSSIFINKSKITEKIQIKDIEKVLIDLNINFIHLIKINVEGCEYQILEKMIKSGIINKFKNIQVQFHDFISNAKEKRKKIQEMLKKTHDITYNYEFVWENHKLREF